VAAIPTGIPKVVTLLVHQPCRHVLKNLNPLRLSRDRKPVSAVSTRLIFSSRVKRFTRSVTRAASGKVWSQNGRPAAVDPGSQVRGSTCPFGQGHLVQGQG
jgi:hypothetical protein